MKMIFALSLMLCGSLCLGQTNKAEVIPELIVLGKTYKNAQIVSTTPSDAIISHDAGRARVAITNLPGELMERYYDPSKEKIHLEAERRKKEAASKAAKAHLLAQQRESINNMVLVDYDKFSDSTTYTSYINVWIDSGIQITNLAVKAKGAPLVMFWKITSKSRGERFYNNSNLVVLYDGKKKDCGNLRIKSSIWEIGGTYSYDMEKAVAEFTFEEFRDIAKSKLAQVKFGSVEFTLDARAKESMRDLVNYIEMNKIVTHNQTPPSSP